MLPALQLQIAVTYNKNEMLLLAHLIHLALMWL